MCLDALVQVRPFDDEEGWWRGAGGTDTSPRCLLQRRFAALSSLPPTHPVFALSPHILRAMTVAVEPLPLMWGDAVATLANVRADESPSQNVQV